MVFYVVAAVVVVVREKKEKGMILREWLVAMRLEGISWEGKRWQGSASIREARSQSKDEGKE